MLWHHHLDAVGGRHLEWTALPLVFQTASPAIDPCPQSLEVDRDTVVLPVETSAAIDGAQIDKVLAARHVAVLARGTGNLR